MTSKRVVFLLLAVIVAGATAFMARAWLQSERAALIAQVGAPKEAPVAPTLQVLVAPATITASSRKTTRLLVMRPLSSAQSE